MRVDKWASGNHFKRSPLNEKEKSIDFLEAYNNQKDLDLKESDLTPITTRHSERNQILNVFNYCFGKAQVRA